MVVSGVGLLLLGPVVLGGRVDAFYGRFTSPPAGGLIVGTSRAAQGIQPAVLAAGLGSRFEGPLLNYAFTLTHSPYGPAYLRSITLKLRPDAKNGLFIVAVDPWSLSLTGPEGAFPEDNSFIGQLDEVSQNPNLAYLARFQTKPLYRLLLDYATATERLHPDGWLEVNIGTDSAQVRARTARKLLDYRRLAAAQHLSAGRLQALRQTIQLLKQHGRVYVVRLPVGPGLLQLEQTYQPGFDQLMRRLAATSAVPYLDYSAQPYATTDGNHLQKAASKAFSQQLAEDLKKLW
ncbi:SGNH/GDSL hydrolase family protein [Hymenobacter sp. IS2118]|uniref:SGNH/GDSL hydrolase family protein n=1 Tax=Hymenobacter sp. IS2118 TaxID=1505605 RepID=UPI0005531F1E|nr:SGNH/GDSL hydrolase family protein [Hymenobacter sp. IS2118]